MNNNSIFDEVLAKSNIIDVISSYIELAQKGKNYWAVCPFHNDTAPSMSVSEEKQIYKCFSCGAGGNSIKFIKDIDSISNIDALKKVATICNVDIEINTHNYDKNVTKHNDNQLKLIEINNKAKDFFSLMLKSEKGLKALKYLESRKIDDEIIEHFGIGLAPSDNELTTLMTTFDYEQLQIADSGLFSLKNNKFFDFYINRIMFPIIDENGNTIAFSSRVYQENDDRAKYANSPESKIFTKSNVLYNLGNAKNNLIHSNEIVVVEGFMDVIALYKAGVKNVVATMGTAFSQHHIKLLKQYTKTITIFMDADEAGQKSASKMASDLIQSGFEVKMVEPIENMDADDISNQLGNEKLQELVVTAKKIFQYLIDNVIAKIDPSNIEQISKFKKFIQPMINHYKNKDEVDVIKGILKTKLSIQLQETKPPQNFDYQQQTINTDTSQITNNKRLSVIDKWERSLVANMINSKDAADHYKTKLHFLPNKTRKHIADYIIAYYKKSDEFDMKDFFNIIKDKAEMATEYKIIARQAKEIVYHQKEFEDLINAMKNKFSTDLQREEINQEINNNDNIDEKVKLLHKRHQINKGK